jgi:hypothetical protein
LVFSFLVPLRIVVWLLAIWFLVDEWLGDTVETRNEATKQLGNQDHYDDKEI